MEQDRTRPALDYPRRVLIPVLSLILSLYIYFLHTLSMTDACMREMKRKQKKKKSKGDEPKDFAQGTAS